MESPSAFLKPLLLGNIRLLLGSVGISIVVCFVGTAIYNLYFHPLRKYPGPAYAIINGFSWHIISIRGDLASWHHKQHEKYGEVVRVGPTRLSYIHPQAWKDIYGHRSGGRLENAKDTRFYRPEFNGVHSLVTQPDVTVHGQQRKIFTNAFSDKALKLQEPLITKYVDQLIDVIRCTLKETKDMEFDMAKLYNCATFDIMGDLTFGEPLGMLDKSDYTPWVKAAFRSIKAGNLMRTPREFPTIQPILEFLTPSWVRALQEEHFQHSVDRVDTRLAKGDVTEKPDIWTLVLEKGRGLSLPHMHANASLFMAAGTETTATLLSGLTFYFLKNPDKMQKAVHEVRAYTEDGLTLERLPRLVYLNACFEEALRIYPPLAIGMPRTAPRGGTTVCGDWVPEGTRLSVTHFAAYHSSLNFKDPESFVPERWLPDTGYDSDRKSVLMPFSNGPRNCLGKNLAYHEVRIIMAKMLWHFDLELCPQSDKWADQKAYVVWEKPALLCKAKLVQ